MPFSIRLFAGPELLSDADWSAPPLTRPLLLLSYLAYQEDWIDRDDLLTLFWPETSESKARQSLRALLYACKKEACAHALEIDQARLRWCRRTDVRAFQEAISSGYWQEAVSLYRGTFLGRVQGDSSAVFEHWLEQTRDELYGAWRDAALQVATELSRGARFDEAADLLQNVLTYDFLDEEVLRTCMRAQALAGRNARALKTFETFREALVQELDMKPLEITLELAEAIRDDELVPGFSGTQGATSEVTRSTATHLQTPFVGRILELLELANLLAQPHNRLITLLGPGGIGKSRLSLKLLETQRTRFTDGAAFVALAGLSSAADIPGARRLSP